MKKAAFIHSVEIGKYRYPADCPFKLERAEQTYRNCLSLGLLPETLTETVAPMAASRDEILTFHSLRYLQVLEEAAQGNLDEEGLAMGLGTPDTPVFKEMVEYVTAQYVALPLYFDNSNIAAKKGLDVIVRADQGLYAMNIRMK